jgi:tetratricopeptide (TPR) repeat protein
MEKHELLTRLHGLEQEINQLKADLQPTEQQNGFLRRCREAMRFLVSNWVVVTIVSAIVTAIVAQLVYGVGPLDDFANIKIRKDLSEFYREQGDRLLERQYFEAAGDAFRTAIEINPNNVEATYGLAKAEVFILPEGQTFTVPGIVDSKLDSLIEHRPKDYQLHLLRGYQYQSQGDFENARVSFQNAVQLNPDFVYGYIALGFLNQYALDSNEIIQETIRYYTKALELEPDNTDALSNLGMMNMLLGDFDTAFTHYEKAYSLSWSLMSNLDLGEAQIFRGNFDKALELHQWALKILNEPGMENDESFMGMRGSGWIYNYMPQKPDDSELISYYVQVNTVQDKQVFLHYALSFDYALLGDLEQADRAFEAAYGLDVSHQYDVYFGYKLSSLENFLSDHLSQETRFWLESRRTQLWTS